MSSESNQLQELFSSKEYVGRKKIIISSAGTSKRNNLKKYVNAGDLLYAEVLPNPSLNQLVDFFSRIRPKSEDIIFGVGGGSVIDFSKLISLFAETPNDEIKALIETAQFRYIDKALRLVVVPTLFGSGAEQTPFAVCYIGSKKYSVANNYILPERVEYISKINLTANPKTKLANVLDCFCQAAESLTAKSANLGSIDYAEEALTHLVPIAKEYIIGKDIHLIDTMAKSSELCGNAIAISKTTGPHAMSYYLTSKLSWDHGVAVAMSFLFFYENYKDEKSSQINDLYRVLNKLLPNLEPKDYFNYLGLNSNVLSTQLLTSINIQHWLASVNKERLSNGPAIEYEWLTENNLTSFYEQLALDI